jgi:hypothetical protein
MHPSLKEFLGEEEYEKIPPEKRHFAYVQKLIEQENSRQEKIPESTDNMSMIKKATNLSKSMATWAGSGFKRVQQHVYEKRLAICRKCQFWQENGNMGMGKCLKCGCGKGKHWLPHEQCPIGLWGKENT